MSRRVDDLVHNISIRTPSFAEFWRELRSNDADDIDGPRVYDVFCELATYLKAHYAEFSVAQLTDFWEWIGWQMNSADEEVAYAVYTSFLESVAYTDAAAVCRKFMPASATEFIDQAMVLGRRKRNRWFNR